MHYAFVFYYVSTVQENLPATVVHGTSLMRHGSLHVPDASLRLISDTALRRGQEFR